MAVKVLSISLGRVENGFPSHVTCSSGIMIPQTRARGDLHSRQKPQPIPEQELKPPNQQRHTPHDRVSETRSEAEHQDRDPDIDNFGDTVILVYEEVPT